MNRSWFYFVVALILKLKGVKRTFLKVPIDYQKLRKEDVTDPKPRWFLPNLLSATQVLKTQVNMVKSPKSNGKLLLFFPGGAFVSGPTQLHWDALKKIAKQTQMDLWLVDYPKAPEHKIGEITENVDAVFAFARQQYPADKIILAGDSVGATLAIALTQRLIEKGKALPKKLILISPVMDASMSNPQIIDIDKTDPMLALPGVRSAKEMCAGKNGLKDPMISPLFGGFNHFPKTIFFVADNDIAYPDEMLTIQKIKEAGGEVEVITGKGMPHIWPLLPVMKEAKIALHQIIDRLQ